MEPPVVGLGKRAGGLERSISLGLAQAGKLSHRSSTSSCGGSPEPGARCTGRQSWGQWSRKEMGNGGDHRVSSCGKDLSQGILERGNRRKAWQGWSTRIMLYLDTQKGKVWGVSALIRVRMNHELTSEGAKELLCTSVGTLRTPDGTSCSRTWPEAEAQETQREAGGAGAEDTGNITC